MQIHNIDGRRLHFVAVPYLGHRYISHTILLHAGYLSLQNRNERYSFYKEEDKRELEDYDQILKEEVTLKRVDSINNKHIQEQKALIENKIPRFVRK